MKWLGWIVAVFLGLLWIVIGQINSKKLALHEQKLQAALEKERQDVEQVIAAADRATPELRRRLAAEEKKTAGFQKKQKRLDTQKAELEEQVAMLEARIETLSAARDALKDQQQASTEEVRQLQARIAKLDGDSRKLAELLLTVSETAETAP